MFMLSNAIILINCPEILHNLTNKAIFQTTYITTTYNLLPPKR